MFTSYLLSLQVKSYWHLNKAWTILQSIIKQTLLFSQADQTISTTSKTISLSSNFLFLLLSLGEEALTMYLAKNKLDRKLANATQNVEALHQLASSYFIDRDGTMRKLHEIQISTSAIKVGLNTRLTRSSARRS